MGYLISKPIKLAALIALSILLTISSAVIRAQQKPKVGLVLAGGGAAGIAHVGVIRELENLGIRPDCVVGTSMGAIIAGLYAAGYSADELEKVVLDIDWTTILNDYADRSTLHPMRRDSRTDPFSVATTLPIGGDEFGITFAGGVVDGQKLLLLLRDLTARAGGAASFDKLEIPFRAIATDLETGEQVIMKSGDLATALRASMSIPALFPAVERNGKLLVDGGVVNNFPTDVARDLCADIVIGVNLPTSQPDRRSLKTVSGSISQLIRLMVDRQVKVNESSLHEQDFLIQPETESIGLLEFAKADAAVKAGSDAVLEMREELISSGLGKASSSKTNLARAPSAESPGLIQFDALEIRNATKISNDVITSRLDITAPGEISAYDLQRKLLEIYGLEYFGSVTYQVEQNDATTALVILASRRSKGNSEYSFGFGLEDDFRGDGVYSLGVGKGYTQLNQLGGRVDLAVGIGSTLGGQFKYEQPLNIGQTRYFVASLSYLNSIVPIYTDFDERLADFRSVEALASGNYIWAPNESLRFGIGLSHRSNKLELHTGSRDILTQAGLNEEWEGSLRFNALFDFDTLDNVDLPHFGTQFSIRYNVDIEDDNEDVGDVVIDALTVHTFADYSVAGFFTLEGEIQPDGLDPHFLGGFQRLSGFSENQLFANITALVGMRAYRNIPYDSLFGGETFIGGSLEYGGVWNDWSEINSADALLHGSVFSGIETPFGPLILGLGFGEKGQWATRLSLGTRF